MLYIRGGFHPPSSSPTTRVLAARAKQLLPAWQRPLDNPDASRCTPALYFKLSMKFDFYRINDVEEAINIGTEDYFYSGHWNFIEWPEKVKNLLPLESTKINITTNKNGSRTINIMPVS